MIINIGLQLSPNPTRAIINV